MKTSQTFFYNEENGNIQYLDKRGFIGELCIVISKKDKDILCLDEIKKIYNLSYKDIVKKFEKVFRKLDNNIYGLKVQSKLGLICLIDRSTEDFEKYCKKNKLKFGQEVSNINKKNLFTKEGKCDIISYKPKESKEELKKMNKQLIKRVAVASLAALMTIPNLTTHINNSNVVYAGVAESLQRNINHAQEMIEKFKKEGNEEGVKNWTANLKKCQDAMASSAATIKEESERKLKNAQKAAQEADQAQALKAEQEYLATTVFPLTARYVKDFVPIVDDGKPHLYERPDLPGVIFTLEKDVFGTVRDLKPNVEITEGEDFHREATFGGSTTKTFDNAYQEIKVTYVSPFNFFGTGARVYGGTGSSFAPDTEKNGNIRLGEGWCQWIGKNMEVSLTRVTNISYKSGWPDYYIGKSVNDLPESEWDPQYGGFPHDPHLRKVSIEEIKPNFKVEFSTQERVRDMGWNKFNKENGNAWVYEQDIYSAAREHGTDYTDEERQALGLK